MSLRKPVSESSTVIRKYSDSFWKTVLRFSKCGRNIFDSVPQNPYSGGCNFSICTLSSAVILKMSKKKIIISVVSVIIVFVIALAFGGKSDVALKTISRTQFADNYKSMVNDGAVLIDVRTPEEYDAGHFQNAIDVDYYADDFKQKISSLNKDVQYFIYCRTGHRSGEVLKLMRSLEFKRVYDLQGGISGGPISLSVVVGE